MTILPAQSEPNVLDGYSVIERRLPMSDVISPRQLLILPGFMLYPKGSTPLEMKEMQQEENQYRHSDRQLWLARHYGIKEEIILTSTPSELYLIIEQRARVVKADEEARKLALAMRRSNK